MAGVKVENVDKVRTKTQIFDVLSEISDVDKKEVKEVMNALELLIQLDLGKKGPGQFNLPGVCKFVTKTKPARPERTGRNPFTGEEMVFKAKPEELTVKIRPLKKLKDAVM